MVKELRPVHGDAMDTRVVRMALQALDAQEEQAKAAEHIVRVGMDTRMDLESLQADQESAASLPEEQKEVLRAEYTDLHRAVLSNSLRAINNALSDYCRTQAAM
eukprot:3001320-Prymnesium_polylepis.1